MTMRNRQILVAAGLIVLVLWALSAWFGSTAQAPAPSSGPSPTGAIGSGPFTFGPSDGVASASPSGAIATAGASGGTSPGGSGNPISTAAATAPPAQAVRWSGTWANTSPDTATGPLDIVWTQDGTTLQGTLAMSGAACFTTGGIEGTVNGNAVTFQVLQRDEVEFEGTISGDSASGTFSMSCDSSQGTWQATRQR